MSSSPMFKPADDGVDFKAMVAEAAYYKAEQRGFAPGREMADWLEAERELTSILAPPPRSKRTAAPRAARKKPAVTKR